MTSKTKTKTAKTAKTKPDAETLLRQLWEVVDPEAVPAKLRKQIDALVGQPE